jgi:hypothetical protein
MNVASFFVFMYLWTCFLFGLWYFYNRTLAKTHDDSERCLGSFFASLFMSWWYWPLMIFYLIQEVREEKRKEIETIKRRAG